MSKKDNSLGEEKFKSKIGGQAVIEGVMMRGIDKASMANRLPNGEIDLETWPVRGGKNLPWYRKVPFIRGVFSFGISMADGYKCRHIEGSTYMGVPLLRYHVFWILLA